MKLKKLLFSFLITAGALTFLPGCKGKPSDLELKSSVENAISNPAVQVTVNEGNVTISGGVTDEASKNAAETAAKSVDGVKNVTNAISVAEPMPVQNEVQIANDTEINTQLTPILSSYKGVKASVDSGIVTLTGDIKRNELPALLQAVMALKPKRVENQLTIK